MKLLWLVDCLNIDSMTDAMTDKKLSVMAFLFSYYLIIKNLQNAMTA